VNYKRESRRRSFLLHRYLRNFGGGLNAPNPPPSVRHWYTDSQHADVPKSYLVQQNIMTQVQWSRSSRLGGLTCRWQQNSVKTFLLRILNDSWADQNPQGLQSRLKKKKKVQWSRTLKECVLECLCPWCNELLLFVHSSEGISEEIPVWNGEWCHQIQTQQWVSHDVHTCTFLQHWFLTSSSDVPSLFWCFSIPVTSPSCWFYFLVLRFYKPRNC